MGIQVNQYICNKSTQNDLASIREEILAAAREAKEAGRHDKLVVELDGGFHYITEPLVFSATENPELLHVDITLRSKNPRAATIQSWGHVFGKDMTPIEGNPGAYVYQFPKDKDGKYPLFHELCYNGSLDMKRTESPSWYNRIPLTPEERKGEAKRDGLYVPLEIAKTLAEGEIGSTEILMCVEWEFAILHVASVDLNTTKELKGETHALVKLWEGEIDYFCEKTISILNIGDRVTMFRNSPAFLTEDYSYAYDYKNGRLYIKVPENTPVPQIAVEYPTTEVLISVEGLSNFTVEDLAFMGVTSKFVCENPYLAGQANTTRGVGRLRNAAILAENTRNMTVRGCSFTGIGGNGVQSVNNSTNFTVENCIFKNVGMCGVTVGNPSYNWDEPKNHTYSTHIINNYFEHIGYDFPAAPCIYIGMVDNLEILHNTIKGCAYSGMSVGWGWSTVHYELGEKFNVRDAEIAYNHIENFMDMLRDGGAIYVLGGNVNPKTTPRRFNRMHDNYAILENPGKGEKYGYYCDGSSSNWDVSHSVMVNCARPLFSQYTVHHAFTNHNHIHDVYFTKVPNMVSYEPSHAPYRDTLLYDLHFVEGDLDALIEAFPVAKEIKDAAGCTIQF